MGTILVYRNDGEKPFCEIALDDGAHVQLRLDAAGLVIERQALDRRPAEILFQSDADTVTDMCRALMGPAPATRQTALEVLSSVVTQLPSADSVRDAFKAAAQAL